MEAPLVRVKTRAAKGYLHVIYIPDPTNGWKETISPPVTEYELNTV